MSDQAPPVTPPDSSLFQHIPHPRISERLGERPPQTDDERLGLNGRIGVMVTSAVGTMWAAYLFVALALVSLPAAIASGQTIIIVGWVAQTFLQLVLLPVIIVGQNVQARSSDKRSLQTFKDAEAILAECLQVQAHLKAQDSVLDALVQRLEKAQRLEKPVAREE